jgi:hypothetical protein
MGVPFVLGRRPAADPVRAAAGNTAEGWAKLVSRMPGKRIVSGEESAYLGLYLCSSHTETFYGQVIPLTGGVYR